MKKRNASDVVVDVVVIGGGLGGLAFAIEAAKLGKIVVVLEQNGWFGGKCGGFIKWKSYFDWGCNGLGEKFKELLEKLGVQGQEFIDVIDRFVFRNNKTEIEFPLEDRELPAQIGHMIQAILATVSQGKGSTTVDSIINDMEAKEEIDINDINMFLAVMTYFLIRPCFKITANSIKESLEDPYGYAKPIVPVGGMKSVIDKMEDYYKSLGGELYLNAEYLSFSDSEGIKTVTYLDKKQELRTIETKVVVSSVHGWDQIQNEFPLMEPSMPISALFMEVEGFDYPPGVHSIVFSSEDFRGWRTAYDQGELFDSFTFHIFKNYPLDEKASRYGVNAYVISPRDAEYFSGKQERCKEFIIDSIDEKYSGFKDSVKNSWFVPACDFEKTFGFKSHAIPGIIPDNYQLPPYNEKTGMYYISATTTLSNQLASGVIDSVYSTLQAIQDNKAWDSRPIIYAEQFSTWSAPPPDDGEEVIPSVSTESTYAASANFG